MKLKYWIYSIFWGTLILLYSTDYFSSDNTDSVFANIIEIFYKGLNADQMYLLHLKFRKFMHFFNYAVLSWLLLFGLTLSLKPLKKWTIKIGLLALLICLVVAVSDELRQHFSPVRGGSLRDVRLDMIGAFSVQLVFATLKWMKK